MADEKKEPMQGHMKPTMPAGTTPSHDRPSFADPVPGNMDPTAPDSPEQTFERVSPRRPADDERE